MSFLLQTFFMPFIPDIIMSNCFVFFVNPFTATSTFHPIHHLIKFIF